MRCDEFRSDLVYLTWGVALLLSISGCHRSPMATPDLKTPDEMILYSLDGHGEWDPPSDAELFHRYPVLGKIEISAPADRKKIIAALNNGIAQSSGIPPACFWPRHGIRAVQNGKNVDCVICFECRQLSIVRDDGATWKTTTVAPEAVLSSYLTKAGISIAP